MTRHLLVAYATKHGSTREVAEALAAALAAEVRPAAEVDDVVGYDGVILGGSLYTGRWHPEARDFLRRHRQALAEVPLAVFALGPRTTEPHDVAGSRAQLERALAKAADVVPVAVAIFGGVLDPGQLRFPLSRLPASDARDWQRIGAWADEVLSAFDLRKSRSALQQSPR